MSVILNTFYQHNTWANLRVLAACAPLTAEQLNREVAGTYGCIQRTLVHLVDGEERYCGLLGRPLPDTLPHGADYPGLANLESRVRRTGRLFLEAVAGADPTQPLTGVRNGEAYSLPVAIVLLQIINHATEHRAHISTILTQLGFPPPAMDTWDYLDSGAYTGG